MVSFIGILDFFKTDSVACFRLGNHSALFAPVLEPSLTIASDCYSAAALACLRMRDF